MLGEATTASATTIGEEAFREQARRGGQKRQQAARDQDLRRSLDDHVEGGRVLKNFLKITDAWLDAKIPGTAEPNAESVAWAMLVLVTNFKLGTREEIVTLLEEVRPELTTEPRVSAFYDVEGTKRRLLDALEDGRISAEDLPVGLLTA